jgi:DNA end-binding protein Ku
LRRSVYVGVAKVTMHQREHTVIIRPGRHGLVLHKMYYQDEIRATDEFRTNIDLVKDKELLMAQSLIDALAAPFEPAKFKDNYRETLRGMIDAKIAGEEVVAAPQAEEIAPVVDIMEALRSSLEALKKPSVTEMPARTETHEKRRAGGRGR